MYATENLESNVHKHVPTGVNYGRVLLTYSKINIDVWEHTFTRSFVCFS